MDIDRNVAALLIVIVLGLCAREAWGDYQKTLRYKACFEHVKTLPVDHPSYGYNCKDTP